jgi:diguanylate cyclase (GGDEF)-like protein
MPFSYGGEGHLLRVALGWSVLLLLLCAGLSWYVTHTLVSYGESIERRAITTAAAAAAASFNQETVESLKRARDDQTSAAALDVRAQLQRIKSAIPDSRFAYLMTRTNGEIVFLADGEPASSKDYSPPGQVYFEATDLLRGVFVSKQPAVEGPVTDRWGDWVSGVAPLIDSQTGEVVAVFGVDVSAKNWNATISGFRWLGISISALVTAALLLFGLFGFNQHNLAAKVRYAARHDPLTGLVNRRVFVEELQQRISGHGRLGIAILYLDLDHFKDVNDTLGHSAGDELLCSVAARLNNHVRRADCVGRFGGDEFAIIVEAENIAVKAQKLANRLITALREPYEINGNHITSGASIGIAICKSRNDDADRLVSYADIALYHAKRDDRGSCKFFTEEMDTEIRDRVSVNAELRAALDTGQLYLEYQPQVDIQSRRITGVEALVRWRHPERGVLEAAQFIPLAERTGLLLPIDRWVLREACRQGRAWLDAGIVLNRIAVNISALHFKRARELERDVLNALSETGFPPESLELELTETGVMAATSDHDGVLSRLRQHGIRLAIDDFGTGYCSLDYLRRYPADRVKIASTFITHIALDAGSATIVKAITALANQLGMVPIAEGIETAEQLKWVTECSCPEGQGFYFARPLGLNAITPLLRRGTILDSQYSQPQVRHLSVVDQIAS